MQLLYHLKLFLYRFFKGKQMWLILKDIFTSKRKRKIKGSNFRFKMRHILKEIFISKWKRKTKGSSFWLKRLYVWWWWWRWPHRFGLHTNWKKKINMMLKQWVLKRKTISGFLCPKETSSKNDMVKSIRLTPKFPSTKGKYDQREKMVR